MSRKKSKHRPHYRVYTRLAPSKIHGVGVVAICSIPKGAYIFHGDDDDLIWVKKSSLRPCSAEIKKLYRDFCVTRSDSLGCPRNFNHLTPAWYLNHSENPNVGCDKNYRFYALRNIKKGEELTTDYTRYNDGEVALRFR